MERREFLKGLTIFGGAMGGYFGLLAYLDKLSYDRDKKLSEDYSATADAVRETERICGISDKTMTQKQGQEFLDFIGVNYSLKDGEIIRIFPEYAGAEITTALGYEESSSLLRGYVKRASLEKYVQTKEQKGGQK